MITHCPTKGRKQRKNNAVDDVLTMFRQQLARHVTADNGGDMLRQILMRRVNMLVHRVQNLSDMCSTRDTCQWHLIDSEQSLI